MELDNIHSQDVYVLIIDSPITMSFCLISPVIFFVVVAVTQSLRLGHL